MKNSYDTFDEVEDYAMTCPYCGSDMIQIKEHDGDCLITCLECKQTIDEFSEFKS